MISTTHLGISAHPRKTSRTLALAMLAMLAMLNVLVADPLAAQQQSETLVKVAVIPDHAGWTYALGEPAKFNVSVLRSGFPVSAATVRYELGPDMMPATSSGPLALVNGRATVDGGTMTEAGFRRLHVIASLNGKEYHGYGTAGFAIDAIRPTVTMPSDFASYWADAIAKARKTPLDATMTLVPERSTVDVNVYHVSFNIDAAGTRLYGMLSMPTAPGKYPTVLQVPGCCVRPYYGQPWAAKQGVIHLEVGVHGVPVNMAPSVYDDLFHGALANYWTFGLESRDTYYFHRIILGAIRAGDFLSSLPQADGKNYGVYGSSQGGALSIITAALDPRITRLSAIHPAFSDHEGFLHGRAGGWPHLFAPWNHGLYETPAIINTMRYYDVANFARLVKAPGWYSWGYNDTAVPPTSTYAAYNVITAPKELLPVPETGHWTYPEQWERAFSFLTDGFPKR